MASEHREITELFKEKWGQFSKIGMGNNVTHNPRKIYHVVVIIWVILFVTVHGV
jgi:hypothetical protein